MTNIRFSGMEWDGPQPHPETSPRPFVPSPPKHLKYRDASDAVIAHMGDEAFNAAVQAEAKTVFPDYDPAGYHADWPDGWVSYHWGPPPENQCLLCYEWRRYPMGQRHFGFAWWRICNSNTCTCAHHETEVWYA